MAAAAPPAHEHAKASPSSAAVAAQVAPPPLRPGLAPATLISLQRAAGNAAVTELVQESPAWPTLQRCGRGCGCATCDGTDREEDTEALATGGRLLRQAVIARLLQRHDCSGPCGCSECGGAATTEAVGGGELDAVELGGGSAKSKRKGKQCDPARTIQGTVFVSYESDEHERAKKMVEGNRQALSKQNINLDLEIKPFLELGDLAISNSKGERTVDSYGQVCLMMSELEGRRTRTGIVILFVPISGGMCGGHGEACYVEDFRQNDCPSLKSIRRLIIVGRFIPDSLLNTVIAHEIGHHAGRSTQQDPNHYGHEDYDPGNYMGRPDKVSGARDHYRDELLDRMCRISFDF